jgi:hypothetical protein
MITPERWAKINHRTVTQVVLSFIFSLVYRKWLEEGDKVLKVRGWRTALVETKYKNRRCMTPCFKLFGKSFD